jgi:glycosyltransferase involved in cell wall biosynthesis
MAGLANGCAIVTTVPQSPMTELVDGRDLLYVPPDDDAALALAIARVADRPELAATLREHARARSELFSWQGIAQAHLALYSTRPTR